MKKSLLILAMVLSLVMGTVAFAASPKPVYKVGEEVYACNCPEGCPCQTMSRNLGKCTCNKVMVNTQVTSVEKDKVFLKAHGWEKPRSFGTVAKYACNCDSACTCDTISQKPGKCPCGKEMKAVK